MAQDTVAATEHREALLACEQEATAVTKFLAGLNLKMRKTILAVKGLN